MVIVVEKKFSKQLKKCPQHIQNHFSELYDKIESVNSFTEIPGLKKMTGYEEYYRIRIGSWRVGLKYKDGLVKIINLMTIGPRSDVYKKFPPK